MIPMLTDDVDLVTASPYHPDGGVLNVAGVAAVPVASRSRGIYRHVLHNNLYTYTSCFRVYRRSAAIRIPINERGFPRRGRVHRTAGPLRFADRGVPDDARGADPRPLEDEGAQDDRGPARPAAQADRDPAVRAHAVPAPVCTAPGHPVPRTRRSVSTPSVGIVGGGMLGMTLAKRLKEAGLPGHAHRGGAVDRRPRRARHVIGEYTWDRFYHVILLSDLHLRGLLEELELADRLRWGTTRTGFYTDGKLYSLSTSLDFALFPPLSLIDKARLGRHHPLRVAHHGLARAGAGAGGRRGSSACRASGCSSGSGCRSSDQAGRELPAGERLVHLGDHRSACTRRGARASRSEMFGYVDGGYAAGARPLPEAPGGAGGRDRSRGQPVTQVRQLRAGRRACEFANGTPSHLRPRGAHGALRAGRRHVRRS